MILEVGNMCATTKPVAYVLEISEPALGVVRADVRRAIWGVEEDVIEGRACPTLPEAVAHAIATVRALRRMDRLYPLG
jgi:hypothetical protein